MEQATHTVTHKGHKAGCTIDNYQEVCNQMIEKYGAGVPTVTIGAPEAKPESAATTAPEPTFEDKRRANGHAAVEGKARAQADHATAERVGYALPRAYFEDGTVLWGVGVDNMAREKLAHEALPLAVDGFARLRQQVEGEERRDSTIDVRAIRLDDRGHICLPHPERDGFVSLRSTDRAAQALLSRTGTPLHAALSAALDTKSREVVGSVAASFETWQRHNAEQERQEHAIKQGEKRASTRKAFVPKRVVVGVRNGAGGEREIYRVVSERFADLPIDRIAQALELACPEDARCRIKYDGQKLQADVEFFSDIKPENAVVGEVWKAVARIVTDDTGGGSIRGDGGIYMALCRNFTYTSSWQSVFALRHMGSVEALARQFRQGFEDVLSTINPFIKQWNAANQEDVVELVRAQNPETRTIPLSEMMAGIFLAQMGNARELVPVPGNKPARARQLVSLAQGDASAAGLRRAGTLTRAGLVNAFTRLAHTSDLNADAQVDVERAASALLVPAPKRELPPRVRWMPMPASS